MQVGNAWQFNITLLCYSLQGGAASDVTRRLSLLILAGLDTRGGGQTEEW